jgi:hypothetical protein
MKKYFTPGVSLLPKLNVVSIGIPRQWTMQSDEPAMPIISAFLILE